MKEIVERLHENRRVELAKSILESNGYKVSKKRLQESILLTDLPPVVSFYLLDSISEEDLSRELKSLDPILSREDIEIDISTEEEMIAISGLSQDERQELSRVLPSYLEEFGEGLEKQFGGWYEEYLSIRHEDEE